MISLPRLSAGFLAASLSLAAPQALFAAADETPPSTVKCSQGKVKDATTGKCVKVESNLLDDDERYEAVREYAYAGQYENAEIVLAGFDNGDDPRVLNYKGFVNRKLGNMDAAMEYYQQALTIDPDYILARSYMGQGLAAQGDYLGAREQLAEIRTRGGRNTWAYTQLAMSLRGVSSDY